MFRSEKKWSKDNIKTFVLICLCLKSVICGPDLCENGAKVDAITYIYNQNMWFLTSGGHYWLLKASDFPPKTPGTPLPGGFKKGDAAIYKNFLDACSSVPGSKSQEMEIHLMEMVNGENQILVYDIRSTRWSDKPTPYNKDRGLGIAKVDWTKPIDAAFIFKKTNIVVIQGKTYSVVDIKNLCSNPDAWGEGKQSRPTIDLNVQTTVDSTTAIDEKYFYLFQDQVFWKIEITSLKASEGKLTTIKNMQQDVVTEFFKFQENCKLPPKEGSETTAKPLDAGAVGAAETQPPTKDGETAAPVAADENTTQKEEEGAFPWIIVIIVIIIIVLIAIVLIACLAMRKGKEEDKEAGAAGAGAAEVTPGASSAGSKAGAKSNLGTSPSKMGGAGGSKVGSKVDAGGVKATGSSLGSSPSTMSVRSTTGVGTSKIGSKTGSKA